MKNLLPSLSKNSVEALVRTAQTRRLQAATKVTIRPIIAVLILHTATALASYFLIRPLLEPIALLGDTSLTQRTLLAVTLFAAVGVPALFFCTLPLLVQSPNKHIAALPISTLQWTWPQIQTLFTAVHSIGIGLQTGIAGASILSNSNLPTRELIIYWLLGIAVLSVILSVGIALNSVAQRMRIWSIFANTSLATLLFGALILLRSTSGLHFLHILPHIVSDLPNLALLITVSLAVTVSLTMLSFGSASAALAIPIRHVPPQSGRNANPATSCGVMHPLSVATYRGLWHDKQSGFFAVCMAIVACGSTIVAMRMNNPLFSSVVITNNATMLPMGFASWFSFARQKIGRNSQSIYTKPQSSIRIILRQSVPLCTIATLAMSVSTLIASKLLGINPLANELLRIAGMTYVIALIGYTCGVIAYPIKGDHMSVLATILCTFLCVGAFVSIDQLLRNKLLFMHILSQLGISTVLLLTCVVIERKKQKGLRI